MKLYPELPNPHPCAPLLKKYPNSQYINSTGNVSFLYTSNPLLIQKFIDLRSKLYSKDPKFVGFRDFQQNDNGDYFGEHRITQVLMDGDRCIGGGMLTFCDKGKNQLLPLEIDLNHGEEKETYRLRKMMPELKLDQTGYVEASRMLVHPDYRQNIEYVGKMFENFYHYARGEKAQYFFAMTDKLRCRMYRKIAYLYTGTLACFLEHLTIPDRHEFEGIKMQIMVWDIQNTYVEALSGRFGDRS